MRLSSDCKPYVRFSVTKRKMLTVFIFLIRFFFYSKTLIITFHETHDSDLHHVWNAKLEGTWGVSTISLEWYRILSVSVQSSGILEIHTFLTKNEFRRDWNHFCFLELFLICATFISECFMIESQSFLTFRVFWILEICAIISDRGHFYTSPPRSSGHPGHDRGQIRAFQET